MKQDEIIDRNRTKLRALLSHVFTFESTEQLPTIKGFGFDQSPKEYYWDAEKRQGSYIVFQYTLSGTGYLATNQKIYELKEGIFFLAELPNAFTYYRGEEEWSFIYIEFSKEFFQWLPSPLQIGHCPKEKVEAIFTKLKQLAQAPPDVYANSRVAYAFFLTIKEALETKPSMNEQIKDYLETHYKKSPTLDEVSDYFQLSKYKMIRQFEKEYQQTPINYLNNYRIIQSLRYLKEEMTIKEIATAVGFSDYNYFSRVFKKAMGLTPSAYRKEVLK
ncbi:MAG: AraC family transcriptional regulator [Enterococcus sp.]|jgi:AraC-like DNA-binding protein|nr:AraC family transcriptional regulator [Enterococcus sp.]